MARVTWTQAEALALFDRWYARTGHWVYPTRERALAVYQSRGIECLPDWPRA